MNDNNLPMRPQAIEWLTYCLQAFQWTTCRSTPYPHERSRKIICTAHVM